MQPSSQLHAFDELLGFWVVKHRRLVRRLVGDTHWEHFDGTMRAVPILAGQGNFDENVINMPGNGYSASTLRIYHSSSDLRTIHWIDGRDPRLDPPLSGRFERGVGTFHGQWVERGKAVRARYLWSEISLSHARWEQAFSADDGVTWETNWIMEFSRA